MPGLDSDNIAILILSIKKFDCDSVSLTVSDTLQEHLDVSTASTTSCSQTAQHLASQTAERILF